MLSIIIRVKNKWNYRTAVVADKTRAISIAGFWLCDVKGA
jgi:hypothetical protein